MMVSAPFHGLWAMLLRISKEHPELEPEPLCEPQSGPAPGLSGSTPYVSRTLIRAVTQAGDAVLAGNVSLGSAGVPGNIEMSISPNVMALAAIACPVRQDEQSIDLLYLTLPPMYGTGEWLALASLTAKQYQQAEAAWEARKRAETHAVLQHELERATAIQKRLVPTKAALDKHRASGLDLAIGFVPSQWVGGDYVDALAMKDGRVLLVVADVCGHGLAAALVAAGVHTLVHACVRAGLSLHDMTESLNEHLCETLPGDAFVTMVGVAIDPRTGGIEYVNAGHPPPLVAGPGGVLRQLPCGQNPPLGMDRIPIERTTDQLPKGQLLLLYSDGLTEQVDDLGEMLCTEGLEDEMRFICGKKAVSAQLAADDLTRLLDGRQGKRPPDDDRTFVVAWRV
jgi:serine phosphatase RsbU (regulator of sigma subunit)